MTGVGRVETWRGGVWSNMSVSAPFVRRCLIWAYPLANTDRPLPNEHAPLNSFGHVSKLITTADKDVVSSNADTIYSSAFLDLKQGAALMEGDDSVPACVLRQAKRAIRAL
jgi:hypothetical protein